MKAHPAAELFPEMSGADFDAFVNDIKENGQLEAVVLHEGMILDGRNRYRACETLGIAPLVAEWEPSGHTPESYVISKNLHRRHLNETQRAMIAARLANVRDGWNYSQKQGGEIPLAKAAELMNVNRSTVVYAKKVLKEGSPEEVAACDRGEASVNTVGRMIARGASPTKRASLRDKEIIQKGKNPERLQKQQMRADLWARLKDALVSLSSMPDAAEVADMVRSMDRTQLVEKRLPIAQRFLKELENGWSRRDQIAS